MEFSGVTFRYGRRGSNVLEGFSWVVPRGISVLLGPNGAGKSTCLALAASILKPRCGGVSHGELEVTRRQDLRAWRRVVGWVPQQSVVVPGMTCLDQVAYAAWLKGASTVDAVKAARHALEVVGLSESAALPTRTLSGGQQRRVGLASALVHEAEVLLLDEPMTGLDPAERRRFRDYLQSVSDRAIVISTHQVDDLDILTGHVAVMVSGRIACVETTKAFLGRGSGKGLSRAESAYVSVIQDAG